jgi:nicotinate-nucleotide adenylyltransferase
MRIGILGGTFDPIHYGHLEMACCVKAFFNCDRMLLMPAYSPPHKPKNRITSSYHRFAMAAMATEDLDAVEVCRLELEAPTQPYTVQTVMRLKEEYSDADLFFVMGADSFRELDTCREYQRLIASWYIVVMTSPGYDLDLEERRERLQVRIEDLRGKNEPVGQISGLPAVFLTDLIQRDISATNVRDTVSEGASIDQWVPDAVARYIMKYRLYQDKNETKN